MPLPEHVLARLKADSDAELMRREALERAADPLATDTRWYAHESRYGVVVAMWAPLRCAYCGQCGCSDPGCKADARAEVEGEE